MNQLENGTRTRQVQAVDAQEVECTMFTEHQGNQYGQRVTSRSRKQSWRGPWVRFIEGLAHASAFTLSGLKSSEKILDVATIQSEICFRMSTLAAVLKTNGKARTETERPTREPLLQSS